MKYILLSLMFLSSQLFAAAGTLSPEVTTQTSEITPDSDMTLAQAKKKKRRKKRRKKRAKPAAETGEQAAGEEGAGEQAAAPTGGSLHAMHEGQDAPYSKIISMGFSYESVTATSETGGVEGDPATTSSMFLGGAYLMRFGSIFAGPLLTYGSSSSEGASSSTTAFGLEARYYFSDIDTNKGVMFAGGSFASGSSKSEVESGGSTVSAESSSTKMDVKGGYAMFLDSNVSIDFGLNYTLSDKSTAGDTTTTKTGYDLFAALTTYL